MPILSRILWGFVGLSLVALVTVVFLVPDAVINLLEMLQSVHVVARFIAVLLIYLIILAFILRRVRQSPAVGEDYLIVNATGAVASITLDSVRERIQRVVKNISDVDRANVQVESLNGRCAVTVEVHTSEDINVPEKHREIARAIEQVVKKQLGLKVARQPRVSLHLGDETLPESAVTSSRKVEEEKEPRRFAGIFPTGGGKKEPPPQAAPKSSPIDEKPRIDSEQGASPDVSPVNSATVPRVPADEKSDTGQKTTLDKSNDASNLKENETSTDDSVDDEDTLSKL